MGDAGGVVGMVVEEGVGGSRGGRGKEAHGEGGADMRFCSACKVGVETCKLP